MTPHEAMEFIERLPPNDFKMAMVDILTWQHQHQKSLVHLSWYLAKIKYSRDPRPKTHDAMHRLLQSIGKPV